MKARPGAVAQVYSYAQKFHETPEFSAYADLPVKALIVSAVDEPSVKELADKFGVLYDVFKPTVYDEWFKKTVIDVNNKNNEED